MTADLNRLGLSEAVSKIRAGALDVRDYVCACYDRIDDRENDVGAWQYLRPRDDVLAFLDQNRDRLAELPLCGLPVAVKDIIDTADMPTAMGSAIHSGRQPVDDAACVTALRQAGALIPGKTVSTEFAYFKPGKTANPRDLSRTPGGSSSGSAASVADFMVPVALGTQTAASVIRPAAYCGITGYVSTHGSMSLRGIQPLAHSFDALGILARNAADISLLRDVLLNAPEHDKSADPGNPEIIVLAGGDIGPCSDDMENAVTDTALRLEKNGAQLRSVSFGDRLKRLVILHDLIMSFEAARHMVFENQTPDMLSAPFKDLLDKGAVISFDQYAAAQKDIIATRGWIEAQLEGVDAILAPAAADVAPQGLSATGAPHMSRPWQAMGLPVLTLPGQINSAELPLGIQLIAAPYCDQNLINLGKKAETILS